MSCGDLLGYAAGHQLAQHCVESARDLVLRPAQIPVPPGPHPQHRGMVIRASPLIPELRAVGSNLRVRGWLWWRRIGLPLVFPYYVTGAITASGGSWNASIVAEVASWGNQHLEATGLGAYIAQKTDEGDFHHIVLGIAVMSLYVVLVNRIFWRPLYAYAERKFRLG